MGGMFIVLLPGAGGGGWIWHRVVPLLQDAGHTAVAVDLPAADESAGLAVYTELVLDLVGDRRDVLLVGQSLGGFTVPMVADRMVRRGTPPVGIVLLNAMVPAPGETPSQWWENVDSERYRLAAAAEGGWTTDIDLDVYFLHDVDPEVAAVGDDQRSDEAEVVFTSACDIEAWPDVPTRVVAGAADRFFPLSLQQHVARDRLGVEPSVVSGGHLAALSAPVEVAAAILAG